MHFEGSDIVGCHHMNYFEHPAPVAKLKLLLEK